MNLLSLLSTPQKLGIAAGVALSILIGGFWLGWHERALREVAHLEAQRAADLKQCNDAQTKTKEANDALQKDRDTIASRLASYKLQHPSTCIPVAGAAQLSSNRPEHAGSHGGGLSSDWLRDYAAQAELYRSSLIVCVDFLDSERAVKP